VILPAYNGFNANSYDLIAGTRVFNIEGSNNLLLETAKTLWGANAIRFRISQDGLQNGMDSNRVGTGRRGGSRRGEFSAVVAAFECL
jgi:hypothetical protein